MNFFKSLTITFALTLITFNTYANDLQTAKALYDQRGENPENALAAAKIYEKLAQNDGNSPLEKSQFLTLQSEALYFFGDVTEEKKAKRELHDQGKDVAKEAAKLLDKNNAAEVEALAVAVFWQAANFARSLATENKAVKALNWPKLKDLLNFVIEDLKQDQVQLYGARRILGGALSNLGRKEQALEHLELAYQKTLTADGKTSLHGLNTIFYAEVLIDLDRAPEAKKVLQGLVDADAKLLNLQRVTETLKEQKEALELLEKLK
jgi:tetratricopeptide (TPR) repeat protein